VSSADQAASRTQAGSRPAPHVPRGTTPRDSVRFRVSHARWARTPTQRAQRLASPVQSAEPCYPAQALSLVPPVLKASTPPVPVCPAVRAAKWVISRTPRAARSAMAVAQGSTSLCPKQEFARIASLARRAVRLLRARVSSARSANSPTPLGSLAVLSAQWGTPARPVGRAGRVGPSRA
jgi:hypothetical protein